MAITGINTLDGKQIIAAGASSAVKAAQDGNGNNIASTYQTTAGMTAYQAAGNYLSSTDSANFLLTSNSGNFYPMTGNPSGFINELPEEEEVEFEEIDLTDYQPVSSMTAYANSADVTGTAQYGLTTAGWSEITAGGGGASNVLILTGTECLSSNGGPVCIRINDSTYTWRWCPPGQQNFNQEIQSENVCTDAMIVVKEITNSYSSFDLSLNLRGVGSVSLQTGTNLGNSAPFYITGYTAAIPVSSPVINYANTNSPCVSGTYTVWSGTELKFYANNYQALASAEQLRNGYTHWEIHGFVS